MIVIGKDRGSLTVEASIIVSIMLIILFAMISSFTLLYQKMLLTSVASMAAQQGAEMWADSRKGLESGAFSKSDKPDDLYYHLFNDDLFGFNISGFRNPYREFVDLSPGARSITMEKFKKAGGDTNRSIQDRKMAKIVLAAYKGLCKELISPEATEVNIEYQNLLVQRKIVVVLTQNIKFPLGYIKAFFDGQSTITLTGKGIAVISEPAEYIRNIDLAAEYGNKLGEAVDIKGRIEELKAKILHSDK